MSSVRDSIKSLRQNAKEKEVKYFKSTVRNKELNPSNLEEGKTTIRLAPPHDPENHPSPFMPYKSTWLEVQQGIDDLSRYMLEKTIKEKSLESSLGIESMEDLKDVKDDELKAKLKSVLGEGFNRTMKKPVFIASLHGKEGDKDLVESYIKFVVDKIQGEIQDREESRKKLSPIFGYRDNGKWIPGIQPGLSFMCYGWDYSDKDKPLYRISLYEGMMDDVEELYDKFDLPDKPLTIDPFSNPVEGVGLIFKKIKNEKGKFQYGVEDVPYNGRSGKTWNDFTAEFSLTKEQLDELHEAEALIDRFGPGSFKKKDYELQLNGLVHFDEKFKFNAFENDEFLEIVEEIANQFDSEQDKDDKELKKQLAPKKETTSNQKATKEDVPTETDAEEGSFGVESNEPDTEDTQPTTETTVSTNTKDRLANLRKNLKK